MKVEILERTTNTITLRLNSKTLAFKIIKAKEIYKQIKNNNKTDYADCAIEDFSIVDLNKFCKFPDNHKPILTDLIMVRCVFILKKNKQHDFSNCVIKKLNFCKSVFLDSDVSFRKSVFKSSRIEFIHVVFNTPLSFDEAQFIDCVVSFNTTQFYNAKITFRKTEFTDSFVNFALSRMKKSSLVLSSSKFIHSRLSFFSAECNDSSIKFLDCDVDGLTFLEFKSSILGILSFEHMRIKNIVSIGVKSCSKLVFSNSIIMGLVRFPGSGKLDEILIHNLDVIGQIIVNWDAKYLNHLIYNSTSDITDKIQQFLLFKEAYRKLGYYDKENSAYIEYKRCEGKINKDSFLDNHKGLKLFLFKLIYYPYYWIKLLLFDVIGLYATSPKRVLITFLTVFLLFGTIYSLFPQLLSEDKNGFYYSIITMLTIGYGDIEPIHIIAKLLSGFEGFLGLFLMAYFTIAFSRKILR
jgi:hypothetical protein